MLKVIIHAVPREYPDEPFLNVTKRIANDTKLLDDVIEMQEVSDTEEYKLKEMQGIVGGLIDILGGQTENGMPVVMVINDEGKLDNLPVNHLATILATDYGMISKDDYIVGDVLLAYDTGDTVRPFTDKEYLSLFLSDRLLQYKLFLIVNMNDAYKHFS